ncbi:hypothetical protein GCM10007907_36190 [Chitinimonas prasina]|uniref:Uncharacterized protein n=1 Tax=Chitinimonas prasina TaxID=1434937 RepID=A0ABQ5YJM5_9NEIS|nr:hypothetical protein [Chitinimonas prasina]GLR14829.1 hypothetical protein GCM10007907_36190 [Chitinimonas prasina]
MRQANYADAAAVDTAAPEAAAATTMLEAPMTPEAAIHKLNTLVCELAEMNKQLSIDILMLRREADADLAIISALILTHPDAENLTRAWEQFTSVTRAESLIFSARHSRGAHEFVQLAGKTFEGRIRYWRRVLDARAGLDQDA